LGGAHYVIDRDVVGSNKSHALEHLGLSLVHLAAVKHGRMAIRKLRVRLRGRKSASARCATGANYRRILKWRNFH
jgi:hypothetical protein